MKKLIALLLWGATSVVQAQDAVIVNAPTLRTGSGEPLQRIGSSDLSRYKGAYSLSNGRTLVLKTWGARMYAAVDDQPQHELAATGVDGFTARDGQMKMHIELHSDGRASGQLLMATAPRQLADGAASAPQWVELSLR